MTSQKSKEPNRVLLISHDWDLSESIVGIIKKKGASITVAPSIQAALEEVSRNHYAVVMIDLNTAGLNGLKISSAAKSRSDKTAILFIVSPSNVLTAFHAIGDGAYGFINRPINILEAGSIIDRAINYAMDYSSDRFCKRPEPGAPYKFFERSEREIF